jgi:hypothetical protein
MILKPERSEIFDSTGLSCLRKKQLCGRKILKWIFWDFNWIELEPLYYHRVGFDSLLSKVRYEYEFPTVC